MKFQTIIFIFFIFFIQGCNGSNKAQIDESDSISSFRDSDKINYRFNDLNKLGIDSILIELNSPKYGEIFLSASDSYSQKDDYRDYCPKYTIDEDSWKILLDGINKYVILKEPFLIKKVKRSDGIIVASDYKTLDIYIYRENNVIHEEIEVMPKELGRYIYIYKDDFREWFHCIHACIYKE